MTSILQSTCSDSFGHESFDRMTAGLVSRTRCPVRGCSTPLDRMSVGSKGKSVPWCPAHGIKLHQQTFVYWNGHGLEDESRLRNFTVRRDLVSRIALPKGKKAESHRLGFEMSEDALTWNVFVSLAAAGRLRATAQRLTGRPVAVEPELYLWGRRIDLNGGEDIRYPDLERVIGQLERDIRYYKTEPDVMLVVPGELVVCIEAKFGSGNPLADSAPTEPGYKPTSRSSLLARYLQPSPFASEVIRPTDVPERLHSQLFRNMVFACEMARGAPWHVVNLVSRTQWAHAREGSRQSASTAKYSFADPTPSVRAYLRDEHRACFTSCTWEDLHADVIKGEAGLQNLDAYLRGKSAHFRAAFDLS